MTAAGFTEEELVETFEEVLEDNAVITKAEVEEMIAKAAEDEDLQHVGPHEVREREDEAATQAAEETFSMTVEQLRETLPADVWDVVSHHLASTGAPLPETDKVGMETDVEKAVTGALTTSGETLRKVRSELAHKESAEPSYAETETDTEPLSKTLLSNFYDSVESKPIRKDNDKEDTETSSPALEGFYADGEGQ